MTYVTTRVVGALAGVLLLAGAASAADKQAPEKSIDPTEMCPLMTKDAVTPQGENAMREFMKSDRAPQAMASMMDMARRMGDGDVTLGMTRMMEMMGSMGGGMKDGHAGDAQPRGAEPGK
jgi:hypothetical protein